MFHFKLIKLQYHSVDTTVTIEVKKVLMHLNIMKIKHKQRLNLQYLLKM